MANNNTRLFGYDLIKSIAIFLIVFYHVGGLDYGTIHSFEFFFPNFNKIISLFSAAGVPLFLMVNGALMLPKHLSLKESLQKALQMFLLFLFGKAILQYLIADKLFSIEEEMVHFWFLGTLGIIYVISFFLNQVKWFQLSVLFLLIIYPFLSNLAYDFILFLRPEMDFQVWGHDGFYTLYALVYFYLGYYLKDSHFHFLPLFLMVVGGLFLILFEVVVMSNHYNSLYDGVNSSFPTIGALLLSSGLYCLLKDTSTSKQVLQNIITFIGSNTLGVYMLHVLFIFLLRKYLQYDSSYLNILTSLLLSCAIICITGLVYFSVKYSYRSIRRFIVLDY